MIAAVGGGRRIVGVHRTWITAEGRAQVGGRKLDKKMLGPCYGRPVRLCRPDPDSLLVVGEGIETTLAVYLSLKAAGRAVTAEAALSLGAMAGDQGADPETPDPAAPWWLPPEGHRGPVLILADPSARDPEAARAGATRARAKLTARGFSASLAVPLGRWDHSEDWADLAAKGDFYHD